MLLALTLTLVQAGLVVHDRLLVAQAARVAAREASLGAAPGAARNAARAATGLDSERLDIDVTTRGRFTTVRATYASDRIRPVTRRSIVLSVSITMAVEGRSPPG